MLKQYVSSPSSNGSDADIAAFALPRSELRPRDDLSEIASEIAEDTGAMTQNVREQLAREVADIEAATAALRRAEPALESWTRAPANSGGKPRPG